MTNKKLVEKVASPYISPCTSHDIEIIFANLGVIGAMPGVIGAIDGLHISTRHPGRQSDHDTDRVPKDTHQHIERQS